MVWVSSPIVRTFPSSFLYCGYSPINISIPLFLSDRVIYGIVPTRFTKFFLSILLLVALISKISSKTKACHLCCVNNLFIRHLLFLKQVTSSVSNHVKLKCQIICHSFFKVCFRRYLVIKIIERM
jgi:hypothetical protein